MKKPARSDTGTTYKLWTEDGNELRVGVRTEREQVEFWAAGTWAVFRVQTDENGCGIHVRPM